jgi:hypothetical protein
MSGLRDVLRDERGAAGRGFVLGVALIAVGLALLATSLFRGLAEGGAVLVIGIVLLAVWAFSDRYAHLVLGSVLTAIGIGGVVAGDVGGSHAGSIALGVGFAAIWALDLLRHRRAHWWLLVLGVTLILGGLLAETSELRRYFWPVALVIVGLLIVSGDWCRRRPRGGSGGGLFSSYHGPGGPFPGGGPGAAGWPFGGASGPQAGAAGDPDVVEGKVVDEDEPAARASSGRD